MTERPQRQRRSVNHYSDDNPSTFTVKRRRGEAPPPPPIDNAAQRRAARAEIRRRQEGPPRVRSSSNGNNSSSNGSKTKRGPGRPPNPFRKRALQKSGENDNNKNKNQRDFQNNDTSTSTTGTTAASNASSATPAMDVIHAHVVSIQPVLPLSVPDRPSLEQRYPQLYRQDYAGIAGAPPLTSWTRIAPAMKERWVPLQQDSSEQSLLAVPPAPWTCYSIRKDDPLYFCVGDAAGYLLLYSTQTKTICIQVVLTSAAKREMERHYLWNQATQKNYFPNSIAAATWLRNFCVVSTRQEVEILDVVKNVTLFSLPLNIMIHNPSANNLPSKRQVFSFQSIDLHRNKHLLLWRPSGLRIHDIADNNIDQQQPETASLYCIDFSDPITGAKRNVIVPNDCTSKDFFCHAAVWDMHNDDALLTVISQTNHESGESSNNMLASLCRITLDGKVLQRSNLPESTCATGRLSTIYTDCVLEQYDEYLFLCTGRGIRCYETNRLTFLTVYGETVALHNKTVGWQGCFWIPEHMFDPKHIAFASNNKNKVSCWIQRDDELQSREQSKLEQHDNTAKRSLTRQESGSNHGTDTNAAISHCGTKANKLFSNMLLVGVPHPTRGPTELQSTLYIWKPGQVLPLTTLQTPPGGLLGIHIQATPTMGWKLTCATAKLGEGWQLSASLKSDFAGAMYPVGYKIINDNVEYLEEEGEFDQVIVLPQQQSQSESPPPESGEESDLQKALKQSLETVAPDEKISVLVESNRPEEEDIVCVPSVPDPSLRNVFEEGDSSSVRSPRRRIRSSPQVLTLFPQINVALERCEQQAEESSKRKLIPPPSNVDVADTVAQQQAMKVKGKRVRMASIELMLQGSIVPTLKHKMGLLHKEWSTGGNRLVLNPAPSLVVAAETSTSQEGDAVPFLLSPLTMLSQPKNPSLVSVPGGEMPSTTVTPSEPSPTATTGGNCADSQTPASKGFCAACHERMVVHTCGKRELPVDTEALERAERLRKEQEEAEAKRVRAERRRLAEAKRREARRLKKVEEERLQYIERMEKERRMREEEERHAELERQQRQRIITISEDYELLKPPSAKSRPTIPKFSELRASNVYSNNNNSNSSQYYRSSTGTSEESYTHEPGSADVAGYSHTATTASTVSHGWMSTGSFYKNESARDSREFTATDGDALAALVGLADSLAPFTRKTPPGEVPHYDYSGSSDRRSAILTQYSSQYKQLVSADGTDETPSYGVMADSSAPNENGVANGGLPKQNGTYSGSVEWTKHSYLNGSVAAATPEEETAVWTSTTSSTG